MTAAQLAALRLDQIVSEPNGHDQERRSVLRVFARILKYVSRYKAPLCLAFALAVLGVAVELARPFPVKIVVDYALGGSPYPAWLEILRANLPGAESRRGMLVWCVVATVLIVAAGAALSFAVLRITVAVCQRLVYELSIDLFAKLQRLTLGFHGRNQVGDLLQRLSGDTFVVYFAVAQVALPAVVSLLSLGGMFYVMTRLDLSLALIALAAVPLLALALALFTKPMDETTARQYEKQGALMAYAQQSLSAVKVVQGFARETYVREKLESHARDYSAAFSRATLVASAYNQTTVLITGTAAALLLGAGASRVLDGRMSVGDLLVFLGYLSALFGPVNSLTTAVGAAVSIGARGRRVFDILDSGEVVREAARPIVLKRARGEVTFENVTFRYGAGDGEPDARETKPGGTKQGSAPPGEMILRDVSFGARPGQITAIVGVTGAGKTSLVSLLPRFYDPLAGRILIDGIDIRDLELRSLRENVSLVLQEPFLFPMSVRDNIAFGQPGAGQDEIVRAAKAAYAHDFIERLPEGYDTIIGEEGASLSGGERQRVAIARALLKDAPILILDEPTSALDAHTEKLIFEALSRLMRNKTTFIISHRLSTIRRADQIFALENGRIVERGTHESLLAENNLYAQLYKHQHISVL